MYLKACRFDFVSALNNFGVLQAFEMIARTTAVERTRAKAEEHSHLAIEHLSRLPKSAASDSLASITYNMLNREK